MRKKIKNNNLNQLLLATITTFLFYGCSDDEKTKNTEKIIKTPKTPTNENNNPIAGSAFCN